MSGAWTCVNIPVGTITGVTAGTDLTGGGTGGNVTLNVDTTKVPQLSGNNTFSGAQTINNNVTVTATGITLTASGGTTGLSGTGSTYGAYGNSSSGTGVYGNSGSGLPGVVGNSSSGDGVWGQSTSGNGVYGQSTSGEGVYGYTYDTSGKYVGVYGANNVGNGVYGVTKDTTGAYAGVYGSSSGAADGVAGINSSSGSGVYGGSSTGDGVYGNSTSGSGVYGQSTSYMGVYGSSGSNNGVYGYSSSGTGVEGQSDVVGVAGQGTISGVSGVGYSTAAGTMGVYALVNDSTTNQLYGVLGNNVGSNLGAGVYGQDSTTGKESNTGASVSGTNGAGVWGDGGADYENVWGQYVDNVGVMGTADDSAGVVAVNNSSEYFTLSAYNEYAGGAVFAAFNSSNDGSTGCYIDGSGDINCTGAKHALVPIDGGQRKVALSAIESPKNWFEDFGSAQLASGSAVVAIEPEYGQTVNTELEYHVFLTPNGDCKGLYVSQRTPASFEVRELGGGISSIEFSYRIVALRKNYESIRMEDHAHDLDAMKKTMAKKGSGTPFRFDTSKMKVPEMHAAMAPHQPPQMPNSVQMPKPVQMPVQAPK